LQEKLIARGRGGYCFEQNAVLRAGLQALGFDVASLIARVIRSLPVDAASPAAHMVLAVELPEGRYLADVGFGGLTPTAPLAMRPHVEQETPHEIMRLVRAGEDPAGEDMVLEAKLGDGWEHLYRIMPRPVPDIDYEVANWMTATHPGSPFVGHLIAARPGPEGTRYTFYNGRLSVRGPAAPAERRMIESVADLRTVMAETFGLALPEATAAAMHDALDRAGNRGTTSPFFT
jgi:N-hydroxyarylamine O-acetyltransferase